MDEKTPEIEIPSLLVGTQTDQLVKTLLAATAGFIVSKGIYRLYNEVVIAKRG